MNKKEKTWKDNSGSASFVDPSKKEFDTWADYKGSGMINGQKVWINAWENVNEDGSKWLNFSFKNMTEKIKSLPKPIAPVSEVDDIPF